MAEEKKTTTRNKPKFFRNDWHKKIKLGSTVKKNRKWRKGIGRHNKLRLNRKGHSRSPRVGWGAESSTRGFIENMKPIRVENVKMLEGLKDVGIIVANVGKKKKMEIIIKANEMKLKVLNKYKEELRKPEEKA